MSETVQPNRNSIGPDRAALATPSLAQLRAEQTAETGDAPKALLLHELGVGAERAADEMAAARDYLAAFNTEPQFREPLEGLVRLLARRKSVKNLGKLLEALSRAAETTEEKSRALVERAAFLVEHAKDDAGARAALEEATAERPEDPIAWLELEILAGKAGDTELRARALEARAGLADDPTWKGLLRIAQADVEAKRGQPERAIEALEAAAEPEGAARYRARLALEALARREGNDEVLARALEAQADLVLEAGADGARGDRLGVPRWARKPEVAADAWLRAADAKRRRGDVAGAATLLDRAMERLPGESTIGNFRLAAAEAAGDTATAARIAAALLGTGITGASAASLHLRIAEAAANSDDAAGALAALRKALEADPGCIPARALELDLLGNGQDPPAFAGALEASAGELPGDGAKGRAYLLAAYTYAMSARDVPGAKAALSQAAMCGVPPGTVARVARMLATLVDDGAWYEEATRRLLAAGAAESEHASLWFELGRARALRGDEEGAAKAFDAIASLPGSAWLGRALSAYALGHARAEGAERKPRSPEALDELAKAESDPLVARATVLAAARRAELAGDVDGARARLVALCDADAGDVVASSYLADLERRFARPKQASQVLAKAAAAVDDTELAAALHLEAGLVLWRTGAKREAIPEIEAAVGGAPAAGAVLAWALRGVDPNSVEDRRRTLDLVEEAGENPALVGLERLGIDLFEPGADEDETRAQLEKLEAEADGELLAAASLGRLLWDGAAGDRSAVDRSVARIETLSTQASAVAAAERLRLARADQDRAAAAVYAQVWARADATLGSSLEWLGAAVGAEARDSEVAARRAVASWLDGEARSALEASAAAVALVSAPANPPPLLSPTHAPAQLMNLELAPLGCDPRRRAAALAGLDGANGDDGIRLDALTLAGMNQLAGGAAGDALATFLEVTAARPDELFAWEGVRAAAQAAGDQQNEAVACAQLGELSSDDALGAMFWESAALLLLDHLHQPDQGEFALEQSFARDPKRALAFDRLFRRVREKNEPDRLLGIIGRRLEVAEETPEIVKLFWEQARVLRTKGDRDGALSALENVAMLEPDHVGALALSGEIYITRGKFAEAAGNLSRLAELPEAPEKQRLMSGIAAVDLYENKLDDSMRALQVLVALHRAGLSTLPVRERLARAAAKTQSWEHATAILEELMAERPTPEGRVEAARLAMAIWRDKLGEPKKAERAVVKLLDEIPDDGEALDLVLSTPFDPAVKKKVLTRGRDALVTTLVSKPVDADRIDRLAKLAGALADLPLRQASLGALIAVGRHDASTDDELAQLDSRVAKTPQVAVDDATITLIGDPGDTGPLTKLFAVLAEPLAEALGPSLGGLGVGKREKVDPRAGLPLRNEIAAWAGALGLGEFDVYVGGPDPNGVQGVPGEVPSLVVGAGVKAPLGPLHRQAVARELFALRRGTIVTRTRDETTVAAIVVAACHLAEVPIDSPAYAMLGDVQRQLGKALSRKTKKLLPDLCREVVGARQDPKEWAKAALASMYRMAAIAAGDVSIVIADALSKPKEQVPSLVQFDDRARRLTAFVLSPRYLELRRRLGMGVT